MATIKHGFYIPKGSDSLADVVRVDRRADGWTHSPRMGGFVMPMDQDPGFADRYEPLPDARLRAMLARWEPGHVTGDWQEDGDAPIPCRLNGELWNGSAVPEFEKVAVDERIVPSIAVPGNPARLGYDAQTDAYLYVMVTGRDEPWDFDYAAIGASVKGEAATLRLESPEGNDVEVEVTAYRGRDLDLGAEGTVRTYGVGAYGWTWSRAEEPDPVPAP